jgi:KDO2-lipid IV(A) lauroyltransferase
VLKRIGDAVLGVVAVGLLRLVRLAPFEPSARLFGRLMRGVGPWLAEHRIGRANLAAAYPEKSPAEIEALLREVWFNLGRVGAEYIHLDRLWDFDPDRPDSGRIAIDADSLARARMIRDDGKPALFFTAHLGNWELCAVAMQALGVDGVAVYRPPNNARIGAAVRELRAGKMGTLAPTTRDGVPVILRALDQGRHVAMVVDQHFGEGVDITFFGRRCKANATLARLARRFECPIHGARVTRLPGHRFRLEVTPEIAPVRDTAGRIDVEATTQRINDVIEGWVREHPAQWLWLHRRWR